MAHKIIVDGVSKHFRLQADRPNSVKEMFTRRGRDKSVDEFWALRDVSFEIPEGDMFALVGHNGSGKSTLLRCIAGIYQPNQGQVRVQGRISTLLELGAGFHPDLSGRENIYMNATMLGMTKKSIDKVFDDIVEFAGVETFIDSPVKVYSTGMYVRLGFSVAVHVRPEILIIDEVIAVGDEAFQRRCFDHLYSLRREGVTIVVVTHGLAIVETMCDGAAWLDHGVLQMTGPAMKVASGYLGRVNDKEAELRADRRRERADSRIVVTGVTSDDTTLGDGVDGVDGLAEKRAVEDVVIQGVTFVDEQGEEVSAITHGKPFHLRIHYDAIAPIQDPVFGFAIHAESGTHVSGTNTKIDGMTTGTVAGTGFVEFTINDFPLTPGEYEVSAAISDVHVQRDFDRQDRAYRLLVRLGAELPPVGLVGLRGSWTFGPAPAAPITERE